MKKILPILLFCLVLLFLGMLLFSQKSGLLRGSLQPWSNVTLMTKMKDNFETEVTLVDDETKATVIMGSWRVVFAKNKNQDTQIRALQEVTNNLKIDSDKGKEIDLRFSK